MLHFRRQIQSEERKSVAIPRLGAPALLLMSTYSTVATAASAWLIMGNDREAVGEGLPVFLLHCFPFQPAAPFRAISFRLAGVTALALLPALPGCGIQEVAGLLTPAAQASGFWFFMARRLPSLAAPASSRSL
jgi:hypothetical protein